jgi:hypothetical protein
MELSPGHGPDLTEKLFGGGIADEKKGRRNTRRPWEQPLTFQTTNLPNHRLG